MSRLPLWARLALISAGALIVLQLVALAVLATRDEGIDLGGVRPSFARQVAGIVRLIDRIEVPARRALALEIVNAGPMSASIADAIPSGGLDTPVLDYWTRSVAQKLANQGIARDRVLVRYVSQAGDEAGPLARLFGRRLQIVVALRSGDYLVIAPDSDANSFLFGSVALVASAVLSVLLMAIVVIAIYRQTRPLGALARNITQFGEAAVPNPLPEQGAPELRALIRATNAMQTQIAALMRNRTVMLAGLSHDLRTLLTKLRLRIELLPPSDGRDRAIGDVEAMQEMTEQALAFAAADAAVSGGTADLAAVVAAVFDSQMLATPGCVSWHGAQAPLAVAMDEASLRRVVQNLVDNAIAYGREADLALATAGRTARLVVGDRGPGIPDARKAEIFEPYVRLEPSRNRQAGGSGLGLAIVKQMVERHGGRVEVADRPGGGSLFTVTLPLA